MNMNVQSNRLKARTTAFNMTESKKAKDNILQTYISLKELKYMALSRMTKAKKDISA